MAAIKETLQNATRALKRKFGAGEEEEPKTPAEALLAAKNYRGQRKALRAIKRAPEPGDAEALLAFLQQMEAVAAEIPVVPKKHQDLVTYAKLLLSAFWPEEANDAGIAINELNGLRLFLEKNAGRRYPSAQGRNPRRHKKRKVSSNDNPHEIKIDAKKKGLLQWAIIGVLAIIVMSTQFGFLQGGLITIFVVVLALFFYYSKAQS